MNSALKTAFLSESCSQDKTYFAYVECENHLCLAMAEAYQGGVSGARAAVEALLGLFLQKPTMSAKRLKAYVRRADRELRQKHGGGPFEVSITLAVSDYASVRYVVCGNTRFYLFRGDSILKISQVQTTGSYGGMPSDPERRSQDALTNLTSYLGAPGPMGAHPTVSAKYRLAQGDILLVSTCSFWRHLYDVELLDAAEGAKDAPSFLEDLQDVLLSRESSVREGFSIAAVFVDKPFAENHAAKKKKTIVLVICAVAVVLVALGLWLFFSWRSGRQQELRETVAAMEQQGDSYTLGGNYAVASTQYQKAAEEAKGLAAKQRLEAEERLTRKESLVTALEQGDLAFESKNYQQAKEFYASAQGSSLELPQMAMKDILKKKLSDVDFALDLVYLREYAELLESLSDYGGALEVYNRLEQLSRITGDAEERRDLRIRIFELEAEQEKAQELEKAGKESAEQQQKVDDINERKLEAEKAVMEKDYEAALELYKEIREEFLAIEESEQADTIFQLIKELQDKLDAEQSKEEEASSSEAA